MNHCVQNIFRLVLLLFVVGVVVYICFPYETLFVRPPTVSIQRHKKQEKCNCTRAILPNNDTIDGISSLCSDYATQRGPHQRVIAISLFGPKENTMFQLNRSLTFLQELINDLNVIYRDGFILRVYHDETIGLTDVVCPFECANPNVDFCNIEKKKFIPPKIWRFIPVGDPLVDLMMSRDLDSAFTPRERASVDVWLASNKLFHLMRDHPQHGVPMLGGMWGFRPELNRDLGRKLHERIHKPELIKRYGGRNDQTFLAEQVWPFAKTNVTAHDSFLCGHNYGQKPEAFPTQRPSANQTNCFIGCVRPCCGKGKMPFGECPKACRPPDHPDWIYC